MDTTEFQRKKRVPLPEAERGIGKFPKEDILESSLGE